MNVYKHFKKTEELIRDVSPSTIASWLLTKGYFPESNILPPSFSVSKFELKKKPYNKNISSLTRRKLVSLSYPKTSLAPRKFGIQHPWNYHDIVYYLVNEWEFVLNHLFHSDIKFFSYSLPLPVSKDKKTGLSNLRAGRMIYEWLTMAEEDLVLDSVRYLYVAKTDITNFYASIYTHSIAWALHGRETALKDDKYDLLGNKLDRLIQYSNDARTNGIAVGSALSDLIAEVLLTGIDLTISQSLSDIDFVAVRFKDDYRILCQSKEDGERILRAISKELSDYNLVLNENKTSISKLPDGLYRSHNREYFSLSLRRQKSINFKTFEHRLLGTLDIHRRSVGTSILDKFMSELFDHDYKLKITLSKYKGEREKEIKKVIALLMLVKRESERILCHALSIIEQLYIHNAAEYPTLKPYLQEIVTNEIRLASQKNSVFEIVWLIFFSRFVGLGITNFSSLVKNLPIKENELYTSMLTSQQKLFPDSKIALFRKPKDCHGKSLFEYLELFKR